MATKYEITVEYQENVAGNRRHGAIYPGFSQGAEVLKAEKKYQDAIKNNPMTPWGRSESAVTVAPGIVRHRTASHGGYILDETATKKVYEKFPTHKNFSGVANAFEEDCDWHVVALTFPAYFTYEALQVAHAIGDAKKRGAPGASRLEGEEK